MARRASASTLESLSETIVQEAHSQPRCNKPAESIYAQSVKSWSSLPVASTFYSFQHYSNLSDFFNDADVPCTNGDYFPGKSSCHNGSDGNNEAFAIFHTYHVDRPVQKKHAYTWSDLQDALYKTPSSKPVGTVLFLRGYQPRAWILAIGERYNVDHEFWRRHLNFDPKGTSKSSFFSDDSLPSNSSQIIQLKVTTLGEKPIPRSFLGSRSWLEILSGLRADAERHMSHYVEKLCKRRSSTRHGDSIVRHFALHDPELFSLEQHISIWTGKDTNNTSTQGGPSNPECWICSYYPVE